ncbi:MAG: hypothetical protein KGP08_07880 [Xanthomonadaceae bacterium]|nr:hypothetical protein [Xanthomonadaceae bacterium]
MPTKSRSAPERIPRIGKVYRIVERGAVILFKVSTSRECAAGSRDVPAMQRARSPLQVREAVAAVMLAASVHSDFRKIILCDIFHPFP